MSSGDDTPKKSKPNKKEKRAREISSDDSGPEDRVPVKKTKTTTSKHIVNEQGEEMMEIGPKRYVVIRDFRGKTFVDIREYYDDKKTGKLAPGKKGISLSRDQYENLKQLMGQIDEKIGIV